MWDKFKCFSAFQVTKENNNNTRKCPIQSLGGVFWEDERLKALSFSRYKSGFRVIVHNQSVIPFPDEDGIDVAVGLQTNVAISRTFYNRLPDPYSKCIDSFTSTVAQKNDVLAEMFKQKQSGKISDYQVK